MIVTSGQTVLQGGFELVGGLVGLRRGAERDGSDREGGGGNAESLFHAGVLEVIRAPARSLRSGRALWPPIGSIRLDHVRSGSIRLDQVRSGSDKGRIGADRSASIRS
ncbi:hypothetical protein OKW34_008762 [Paraburkholderia youngii]